MMHGSPARSELRRIQENWLAKSERRVLQWLCARMPASITPDRLTAIGMGGAAIGVGNVAGNYLAGALRNPSAAAGQTATLFIGIAFAEALGIFSFLVALLLMFAV